MVTCSSLPFLGLIPVFCVSLLDEGLVYSVPRQSVKERRFLEDMLSGSRELCIVRAAWGREGRPEGEQGRPGGGKDARTGIDE